MDRMEQMLAFARNCAKEAGKIQLSYFRGNHLHIETKFNMHDVVTVADKESERYIMNMLYWEKRVVCMWEIRSIVG